MSGYNYQDQGGCPGCNNRAIYSSLEDTTHYDCDQHCLCRNTSDRSTKDKMYYDYYVLGKPINLAPGAYAGQENYQAGYKTGISTGCAPCSRKRG